MLLRPASQFSNAAAPAAEFHCRSGEKNIFHGVTSTNVSGLNFPANTPQQKGHRRGGATTSRFANMEGGEQPQFFPDKCPLDRISALLMESFPHITLRFDLINSNVQRMAKNHFTQICSRNNEPQTLTDATFCLAKRALLAAKERQGQEGTSKTAEAADDGDGEGAKEAISNETVEMVS